MKNKKKNLLKMFLSAVAVIGAMALFSGNASAMKVVTDSGVTDYIIQKESEKLREEVLFFDGGCREAIKCGGGYVPPPKNPFVEDDFGDAVLRPEAVVGMGTPTGRAVDKVTTPDGVVDMGGKPDDRSNAKEGEVVIPGLHDISFAVDNGDGQITGNEALDLAVGKDPYFEATKITQNRDVIELCF